MTDPSRAAAASITDFPWPDFDRWQAAFTAAGVFPPRWEGLQRVPPGRTSEAEAYRLRKRALFHEWQAALAQQPVVRAHYARRGIRARVVRQQERAPCPVCESFSGCEVGAGLDAMPPFHPGCRCVLVAVPSVPAAPRTLP